MHDRPSLALVVLAGLLTLRPPPLAAQTAPVVVIAPTSQTVSGYTLEVTVDWCGYSPTIYDPGTRQIRLNGQDVSAQFTTQSVGNNACSTGGPDDVYERSTGTLTLVPDINTFTAQIATYGGVWGSDQEIYTAPIPPGPPVIDLAPHNGQHRNAALCLANCFNASAAYATPAYVSLDAPRAVAMVYSTGQVQARHTIQVNFSSVATQAPDRYSIKLRRPNGSYVTFTNGVDETFFTGASGPSRLAVQFEDTTLATGAHSYTLVGRAHWGDTTVHDATVPLRLLVVNERTSPYGAGWMVAGVPRIRFGPADSLTIVAGSTIEFWKRSSCNGGTCVFTPPTGVFDSLKSVPQGGDPPAAWRPYRRWLLGGGAVYFDVTGRLRETVDAFGNQTRFVWLDAERLDSIVDPAGKAIVFAYDGSNRLASIRDVPGNRNTTLTVNTNNNLTQIQDPVGGRPIQAATYDGFHRLLSFQDRRGSPWTYTYDSGGRLATDSTPSATIADTVRRLGNAYRSSESAVLPTGGTSYSSPATPKSDSADIAVVVPSAGATRKFRVDVWGALKEVLAPLSSYAAITRNASGQPTLALDSTGSMSFTWNGPRLLAETNLATNVTITYEWNTTLHRITRRYGGGTAEVKSWYGSNGRLDSTRVGNEPASRFTYDSRGRVATATDPRGHVTTYVRDLSSFLNTDTVRTSNRWTRYGYDSLGRAVLVGNKMGGWRRTVLDTLNRALKTIGPMNDTILYTYADSLNLTQLRDPIGQVYRFEKNRLGLDTVVFDPNNRADRYVYNRLGHVIRWTNRRGQQSQFSYDTLSRLASRSLSDGRVTSFVYSAGRVVASNEEGSDTLRIDDDTAYAVAVRGGNAHTVRSRFSRSARQVTQAVWRAGQGELETIYQMDTTARLKAIIPPSASADSVGHSIDGLPSVVNLHGAASITHNYRPGHQLARLSYTPSAFQSAFGAEYVHDSLGRVREWRSGNLSQMERYTYDLLHRLRGFRRYNPTNPCTSTDTLSDYGTTCPPFGFSGTLVAQDTFTYDLVGNRTDSGAVVDWGNRQRMLDGYTLEYDYDGNVTRKYRTADSGLFNQRLFWNSLNQLDSVKTIVLGPPTVTTVARFGYDGFGRRVRKSTDAATVRYVWAGRQVVAEYDGSGNLVRHYTYYAGADRPHSVWSGGARHYFVTDGRTNVMGLVNSSGSTIEAQYRFKPFGDAESATGTVTNNIRFAGRELDPETGLYYNRARYYDPQLGRFVSEDPIRLAGGINPYAYAGNDPINLRDPSGLECGEKEPQKEKAPPALGGGAKDDGKTCGEDEDAEEEEEDDGQGEGRGESGSVWDLIWALWDVSSDGATGWISSGDGFAARRGGMVYGLDTYYVPKSGDVIWIYTRHFLDEDGLFKLRANFTLDDIYYVRRRGPDIPFGPTSFYLRMDVDPVAILEGESSFAFYTGVMRASGRFFQVYATAWAFGGSSVYVMYER